MKKFISALLIAFVATGIATARDTYAHDASVLPTAAQTVLAQNFKAKVSVVKIEKDFGRVSEYEVILMDGTEVSFDAKGNWDNIEVNRDKKVPDSMVPAAIRDYVSKHQKGTRIIGIDKERRGYDIELSNGVEMKFDKAGNFLRYDD